MKTKKQIKQLIADLAFQVDRNNPKMIEAISAQLHVSLQNYLNDIPKTKPTK